MANELGKHLEKLRGKISLREAAERAGLSHTYIRDLELGVNRVTKTPIRPTPETLFKLSEAYNSSYDELMFIAGYSKESKNEREDSARINNVSLSVMNEMIEKHGADFTDPEAAEMLEQLVKMVAKMQKKEGN